MRGINKVILLGTLGADPIVKYSKTGNPVATVSLVTNQSWTDKETGKVSTKAEWHNLVFFGKNAETAGQNLRKGFTIYLEGSLQKNSWKENRGVKEAYNHRTDIIVSMFRMVGDFSDENIAYDQEVEEFNANISEMREHLGYIDNDEPPF